MAFTKLEEWSETAASNTEINGIVLSDSTQIDALDNIEREHMAQIAKWLGDDTLASATTTDLGSVPGRYVSVTGTTTITALGTIKAGTIKHVKFTGILTLTQNATSLILPGGASIVTVAGDTAVFVSEGSGNWRCTDYQRSNARPATVGWEILGQGAVTAAASISLIDADSYVRLRITGFVATSADGATLTFRTRTANTVDSGGSDYSYLRIYTQAGAVGTNTSTAVGAVPLTLSNVGNATGEGLHFTIEIEQLNKTTYAWGTATASETASDGTRSYSTLEFQRVSTAARNGFDIAPSSGTITGSYMVEGMRG
jgi:hypothetical protein